MILKNVLDSNCQKSKYPSQGLGQHLRIAMALSALLLLPSLSTKAQSTPEALGDFWIQAIEQNAPDKIRLLVHPSCPPNSIKPEILARMTEGPLPPRYKIEVMHLSTHKTTLEKTFWVLPENELSLRYITTTKSERKKYGIGKSFHIAQHDKQWYFVICPK